MVCDGGHDENKPIPNGDLSGGVVVTTLGTRQWATLCGPVGRVTLSGRTPHTGAHGGKVGRGTREREWKVEREPIPTDRTQPRITKANSDAACWAYRTPGQPVSDLSHVELPVGLKHITRRRMRKQLRMS